MLTMKTLDELLECLRVRFDDGTDPHLWGVYIDMIKSAVAREREAVTDCNHPGNAAAMREALEAIHDKVNGLDEECGVDPVEIRDLARAALSAPARNCDIYATATEAIKAQDVAFNEDNFKNGECRLGCPGCDDGLIDCKILWLFAPAERKGEGDGR